MLFLFQLFQGLSLQQQPKAFMVVLLNIFLFHSQLNCFPFNFFAIKRTFYPQFSYYYQRVIHQLNLISIINLYFTTILNCYFYALHLRKYHLHYLPFQPILSVLIIQTNFLFFFLIIGTFFSSLNNHPICLLIFPFVEFIIIIIIVIFSIILIIIAQAFQKVS